MKYFWFILVAALMSLGIAVRFIEVINGNYVLGFDQGRDLLAARSIAVDHKLTLIGAEAGSGYAGLPGIFHGPGYYYLLAMIIWISLGNPYGAIIFLAILSIAVLVGLFRLTKALFGGETAMVVTILAALSPPLSAHARMIWAPNFSGIVVAPYLFSLWWSQRKTTTAVFVASFLAAALYHFEIPMAISAIAGTFLYYFFVLRIREVRLWFFSMMGVIAAFVPMILFIIRHGSRMSMNPSSAVFHPLTEFVGDIRVMLLTIRESFVAPLSWVFILIAFFFAFREKRQESRQYIFALCLLLVGHFLVFYPYRGPVYPHYLTLLYFVYPILAGFALVRLYRHPLGKIAVIILGSVITWNSLLMYPPMIRDDITDYGGTAKVRGKIDAIDWIYRDAGRQSINVLIFSPPVYTYPYEYLFRWYGISTYGYMPGKEKSGITYLLIEPDPEKPWSYKGWLETVIKEGDIIAQVRLPSGFIIEKRRF